LTLRAGALTLAAVGLSGCSVLIQPDLRRLQADGASGPDVTATDGTVAPEDVSSPPTDAPPPPPEDTGPAECVGGCDDRISCTIDRCNSGRCVFTPDNTACGPDMRCDPAMGCMRLPMRCARDEDCRDGTACTVDRCTGGGCINTPLDRDGDGAPAARVDGTMCAFANADCNDEDRAINPMAAEVCDRVDNNCNGMVDELPACMSASNATCATATRLDLTSTTSIEVMVDTSRGTSTVTGYCGDSPGGATGEAWFQIAWPPNRDLVLEAVGVTSSIDPLLFVGNTCGQPPIVCNDDITMNNRSSRVILRGDGVVGFPASTVLVAVDGFNASSAGQVRFRARTQGTTGSDCSSAMVIEGGGAVRSTAPLGSSRPNACGGLGPVENYRYRGGMGSVTARTTSGNLALRRDCMGMVSCPGASSTFNSSMGDTVIAVERPMGPYVLTVRGQ
jgi:hypothetical protein